MLNYVAAQVVFFALRSPTLRRPGSTAPISKPLDGFVNIPLIVDLPAIRLDYSFIIALVMAAVVSFLLFRTTKGFELRASGFNLTAARYAGMSAGGSMMVAMALSGALAGLAGSFMVIGTVGRCRSTSRAASASPRSPWPCWPASDRAASWRRHSSSGC